MSIRVEDFTGALVSSNHFKDWLDRQKIADNDVLLLIDSLSKQLPLMAEKTGKRPVATERFLATVVFAARTIIAQAEVIFPKMSLEDRVIGLGMLLSTRVIMQDQVPQVLFESLCAISSPESLNPSDVKAYLTSVFS